MSLELHGPSDEKVTVSEAEWYFILIFAEQYGWMPAGTVSPRYLNPRIIWDGQYDLDAGQQVTAEDATEMARALQFALKDPYRKEIEAAVSRHLSKVLSQITGMPSSVEFPDITDSIEAVMELCRRGSFTIGSLSRDM
jgi:hypothetical protein